jgi:hypothetical protein
VPHYRNERGDAWLAFSMVFERPRLLLPLLVFGIELALALLVLGAGWMSPTLGIVAMLGAVPAGLVVGSLGVGALSYQTRRRIEGHEASPGEALAFAKDHAVALVGAPFALGLLALVPPILLGIKSLLSHIPSIGPAAAGLSLGLDMAATAATLFLLVASALGASFCPVIVAFEETSLSGTVRALLEVVKSSVVRLVLWTVRPNAAIGALGFALLLVAVVVAAVPLAANYPIFVSLLPLKGAKPVFELSLGLVGAGLWVAVLLLLVVAVLVSTKNALTGLVYLGCRTGNDDLVTRDDYLAQMTAARKAEAAHEQN